MLDLFQSFIWRALRPLTETPVEAEARRNPGRGDYESYLTRAGALGSGFEFGELVSRWNRRKRLPPEDLWPRMPLTVDVALELRVRMLELGARGLTIAAAYRPSGGSPSSQHKRNAALDLDLLKGDRGLAKSYYLQAAKLWSEKGGALKMGLGFYGNGPGGIRVHIDTGWRCRTWQGVPSKRPPLAVTLCRENGWPIPSERYK